MNNKNMLAFDFGASSGRAMLGTFDGEKIKIEEIHRFSNDPVMFRGTMYWDVLRLFFEMKQGLIKAKQTAKIDSIGIDTWGVDFGLLDKSGRLLENPVHYRDARTNGMLEEAFKSISKEEFYAITGNQFMEINTAFQLLSLVKTRPELLERAEHMLLMPDLLNYMFTGEMKTEYSIASTTQILNAKERTWSSEVIKALSIPEKIFTEIIPTGTKVGTLTADLCEELNIEPCDVIAVAGHDTQCAMASVPTQEDDFIFLSCGTWSLLGTELSEPLIDKNAEMCNVTNEGGYDYKASFLKNIIGLWLIQETRRQWKKEGDEMSFSEMTTLAESAEGLKCFIDPDSPEFVPSGNIPKRVMEYCERTGQYVPQNKSEILRCILESLAMKYRYSIMQIELCAEKSYNAIHIVGGGTQNGLLCQMTANATGKKVVAGPVEATVFGNIALQLLANGEISSLKEARKVIKNSENLKYYDCEDVQAWEKAYEKFKEVTGLC
ncbi:MAG: rhamnulokinase family protein [Oscillospiraceae bacterium]